MGLLLVSAMAGNAQTQHRMTVNELFEAVEQGSKSLRTQRTGTEIGDARIAVAKGERLPDLSTSLAFSYNGNALLTDRDMSHAQGVYTPHLGNSFTLEAQQVVYAGGAIDAGIKVAELQRQQADLTLQLTREQLRFMALGQYLDLFKIDNRAKVYEQNIILTQRLMDDMKAKQSQGMALKNDVTRYELQMETLKLGLTQLRNERLILNHQLCNLLGRTADETILPDTTIAHQAYDKEGEQAWQTETASLSPRMQLSTLNVRLAEQQERLAKSELKPKIALVAANDFNGPITYEVPPINKNINFWYVGVGIKYNLSSLYKSNRRVRQATVETRQQQEMGEVTAEELNNAVQSAYTLYLQAYVELDTQVKSVELSRQNYQVMNDRYLNQLALVTDMIDASNMKLNAELQEVDARINIAYAYYKMKYLAGTL